MKQNKHLHVVIAVVVTASVVVGAMYLWHISTVRRINTEQRRNWLQIRSQALVINDLKARITALEEALSGSPDNLPPELLKIYGYNGVADMGTVAFCLAVPDEYTLTQKLLLVAKVLNSYGFSRGMIEFKRVEKQDGKLIAIVDLRETKDSPSAWKGWYFQGSSGGGATTYILSNTFLQPDYSGAWVDGVEFWYEGKPIDAHEWDHIFLHGTMYRK